jgi:hypothetical protein
MKIYNPFFFLSDFPAKVQQYLVNENFHSDCLTMTIKFMDNPVVQAVSFELFNHLGKLIFRNNDLELQYWAIGVCSCATTNHYHLK